MIPSINRRNCYLAKRGTEAFVEPLFMTRKGHKFMAGCQDVCPTHEKEIYPYSSRKQNNIYFKLVSETKIDGCHGL